jgi:hypothetical protein
VLVPLLLAAVALAGPSAPTVVGPRVAAAGPVTYLFRAHERGVAARAIRYRCGLDTPRLRTCPRRYRVTLSGGTHVLRVRAVDPRGRISRVTTVTVQVREPEIRVGRAPLNAIAVGDTIWTGNYGDGTV